MPSRQVQLAVTEGSGEAAFVCDALQRGPAAAQYLSALGSELRSLLLSPAPPLPVGFAFAADAQKLAAWLREAEAAGGEAEAAGGGGEAEAVGGEEEGRALVRRIREATVDVPRLSRLRGRLWRLGRTVVLLSPA